jgi:hypothetical protein
MKLGCLLGSIIFLSPASADPTPSLAILSECTGDCGGTAQSNLSANLANGVAFYPVLTTGESTFLSNNPTAGFVYSSIPDSMIQTCSIGSTDSNAASLLSRYAAQAQRAGNVWRLGMPEWDQSGGCWVAAGRPNPTGMSDVNAYNTFTGFYLNTLGFSTYLGQTAQQRGYKWMNISDYSFSPQYAYDMGADTVLLERINDEVDGLIGGLAMLRGAAHQHGDAAWGFDISTWRFWTNTPTQYSNGNLTGGWSTNTFRRNFYIAYMGGANLFHMEAADYVTGHATGQSLNPLGLEVQAFYNFAVTRHPNRGTPYVPMAIMQDHYSGFIPKFGMFTGGAFNVPYKWFWKNPYTNGDLMLANLMQLIYPNYNQWAVLPTGSPPTGPGIVYNGDGSINVSSTQSAYVRDLANNDDPRPWEPLGSSQWGETFDIITNQAPLSTLLKYKVIVLATGVQMSSTLLATLSQYVQQGGILVVNVLQLPTSGQQLAGVTVSENRSSASSETWVPTSSTITESSSYNYTVVTPTRASVVATTSGNPIVTKNAYGAGLVYLTTPDYMENAAANATLNVASTLIGTLQSQFAVATVTSSTPLEYLINTDRKNVIVTLVNTQLSNTAWTGTISFPQPATNYSLSEWVTDTSVSSSVSGGNVNVSASVPAYDVRVYVLTVQ